MSQMTKLIGTLCALNFLISYVQASPEIAADITENYRKVVENCGDASKPAYLCSGVLLRAGNPGMSYHIWGPSPEAEASGSMSFSYLRTDIKFPKLAENYNSGYILYPISKTPAGMLIPEMLCVFPDDGDANNRRAMGCGANENYPYVSRTCQDQKIKTAEAWFEHYNTRSDVNKSQRQCGFDISKAVTDVGDVFFENIKASYLLAGAGGLLPQQNEIRLATWSANLHTQLPIQAFFYTADGLLNARYNQQDFYKKTKQIIPIIKLTLPQEASQEATFTFIDDDQAVREGDM